MCAAALAAMIRPNLVVPKCSVGGEVLIVINCFAC